MAQGAQVKVRRAYDPPSSNDGKRVLVDRLWPRGVSKERAHLDDWYKQISPSPELRTWYAHDPAKYEAFAERYRVELQDPERAAALEGLRGLAKDGPLTLITATKDSSISEAQVLADILNGKEPAI